MNEQLPALKAGGLYKFNCPDKDAFVEASPSRAFRDGEGTFFRDMEPQTLFPASN